MIIARAELRLGNNSVFDFSPCDGGDHCRHGGVIAASAYLSLMDCVSRLEDEMTAALHMCYFCLKMNAWSADRMCCQPRKLVAGFDGAP